MDEFAKLGVVKLKKKEILALFKAIDIDESGQIDYTEFIASFMGTKASTNEKYLQTTFQQFDKNGDGTISKDELKQVLYGDGGCLDHEDEIENIIKIADKNGDGEIDYNELIDLMEKVEFT